MADLEAYRMVIEGLRDQAQACKVRINKLIILLLCSLRPCLVRAWCFCLLLRGLPAVLSQSHSVLEEAHRSLSRGPALDKLLSVELNTSVTVGVTSEFCFS